MRIEHVPVALYEDVLGLERTLFGQEAFSRHGLMQHLRIFPETCFVALNRGVVHGYVLGLVKSSGEAWVTSLACMPQAPRARHVAFELAQTIARQMSALNVHACYATTGRHSIVSLARRFNGRIVETVENYFLDGQPRHILEFRPG